MNQFVCVYCAASDTIAPAYFDVSARLGRALAERGDTLVYGGGSRGLMGEVARAVHDAGGRVVGVIPKFLLSVEFAFKNADELIITEDMRERKGAMESRADAFIALAGGIGTLEEIIEIMTLRQLRQTEKPLVLINTEGFYDPFMVWLRHMEAGNFLRLPPEDLFYLAHDVDDALEHIDGNAAAMS